VKKRGPKMGGLYDLDDLLIFLTDFLLVRHSNLSPILHHFGDIAALCAEHERILLHR